jgi:RNA polymerase sigma-70 factor (ECF subfamily)
MAPVPAVPGEHDEETLILLAVKGDEEAFGALYTRHLDAIYRYIYFRVGDAAEAENLTGDVFYKAWEALSRYKAGRYPFSTWLYRIAHNLTIDHHRKKRAETLPDVDYSSDFSTATTTEEIVEQWLDEQAVAAAIRQLDYEEQQVVVLRFIEGLSHQEVAAIIGKSNEASRVILHRALARLNRFMSKQGKDNGRSQ